MKTITIDDDSRYVIIVEDKKGRLPKKEIDKFACEIQEWYDDSNQKFLVLHQRKEIRVKFERISIG